MFNWLSSLFAFRPAPAPVVEQEPAVDAERVQEIARLGLYLEVNRLAHIVDLPFWEEIYGAIERTALEETAFLSSVILFALPDVALVGFLEDGELMWTVRVFDNGDFPEVVRKSQPRVVQPQPQQPEFDEQAPFFWG